MKTKKPAKSLKHRNIKIFGLKIHKILFILSFATVGVVLLLVTKAAPVPPTLSVNIYCSGGYPYANLSWNDTGQNYVVDMDDDNGSGNPSWDWFWNKAVGRATSTTAPQGFKASNGSVDGGPYPYGALTNGVNLWFRVWDGYTESPSYDGIKETTPNCPPTPPTNVHVTQTTTSSFNLAWNASAGVVSDYVVWVNHPDKGVIGYGPIGCCSASFGSLKAGATYGFWVQAENHGVRSSDSTHGSVTLPTNPSPSPIPSPSPTPTPISTKPPTNSTSSQAPPNTVSNPADTTPPSLPTNFQATAPDGKTYVELRWDTSSDDQGVSGYELQRSTDQQNWTTIQSNFNNTSYTDNSVSYNTHYFYRLRAIDISNNYSDYATADVTTPGFSGNASKDQVTVIHNNSNNITVTIPAGALPDNAQCDVAVSDSILSPIVANYRVVDGPYQLICKKNDSALITEFLKPITVEWKIKPQKGIGDLKYYVYSTNKWQTLKLAAHNKKTHADSFVLGNDTTFVAMGNLKHTPIYIKILEILGVVGLMVLGVAAFLYRRYRNSQQATLNDYWRKMTGG